MIRRPLIEDAGVEKQLPVGDTIAGLPLYIPAYTQAAAMLKLTLSATYSLLIYQQGGGSLAIQVVI